MLPVLSQVSIMSSVRSANILGLPALEMEICTNYSCLAALPIILGLFALGMVAGLLLAWCCPWSSAKEHEDRPDPPFPPPDQDVDDVSEHEMRP